MTIIPWHKNVQRKNTLTYSVSANFKGGHWMTVLDKAIAQFNQLMSQHGLKLSITKVQEGMGPHILLETEPGNGIHGRAPSQTKRINGVEYLDSVTIRVPATPRIHPNDPKSREVGSGVRLFILVHELIHSVGPRLRPPTTSSSHLTAAVRCRPSGLARRRSPTSRKLGQESKRKGRSWRRETAVIARDNPARWPSIRASRTAGGAPGLDFEGRCRLLGHRHRPHEPQPAHRRPGDPAADPGL
jgi:hypothetical protein